MPPAAAATINSPSTPAPVCKANMPAFIATKNGKACTANVKISQQSRPMPMVLRSSPRASMVVAPMLQRCSGRAFHHHRGAGLDIKSKRGGVAAMQLHLLVGKRASGAYAPPNFQTGMPRRFALSARLSWIPVPGKCMTPIGSSSSMASLRLNGAALACFVQSGLNAICGTFRAVAHLEAISSAPFVEPIPDQLMVVEIEAAREGNFRSGWQHDLGVGAALRCDEIAGVDQCRGE